MSILYKEIEVSHFNPTVQQVRRRMLGHKFLSVVSNAVDQAADVGKREATINDVEAESARLLHDFMVEEGWKVFLFVVNDTSYNVLIQW